MDIEKNLIDWVDISKNSKLTPDKIRNFKNFLKWDLISELPEYLILENTNVVNWIKIYLNQSLSLEFKIKYYKKIPMYFLIKYNLLPRKIIINLLSKNNIKNEIDKNFSKDFIDKYGKDKLIILYIIDETQKFLKNINFLTKIIECYNKLTILTKLSKNIKIQITYKIIESFIFDPLYINKIINIYQIETLYHEYINFKNNTQNNLKLKINFKILCECQTYCDLNCNDNKYIYLTIP